MLGLQGFAAEDFRFQIKNKTTEALLAKFERGYATGGAPLGYKLIPARDGSNNKELAIIPEEASIVERIFTLMADGKGLRRTRTALNDASIVNPRGTPWSLSNLREIIHRDLYRGEAIYGKTVRAYTYGTSEKSRTDASQWHRKTLGTCASCPSPCGSAPRRGCNRRETPTFAIRPASSAASPSRASSPRTSSTAS